MGKKNKEFSTKAQFKVEQTPIVEPVRQRSFRYAPQEDITAYEVAQLLEFVALAIGQGNLVEAYERLPDAVKRHLEVQE